MTVKVEIANPTNACVAIKTDQGKILIDPWLDDGTWHNFPRVTWERHPEPFDIDTQNALTYFCQPIMRSS